MTLNMKTAIFFTINSFHKNNGIKMNTKMCSVLLKLLHLNKIYQLLVTLIGLRFTQKSSVSGKINFKLKSICLQKVKDSIEVFHVGCMLTE